MAVELTAVAIGAAMLVGAVIVLVYARRFAERGYEKQERYRSELFDAELSALTRLQEANRIREDLVASVSHEFRTPLTAIRGSAATLAARGDRILSDATPTTGAELSSEVDAVAKIATRVNANASQLDDCRVVLGIISGQSRVELSGFSELPRLEKLSCSINFEWPSYFPAQN